MASSANVTVLSYNDDNADKNLKAHQNENGIQKVSPLHRRLTPERNVPSGDKITGEFNSPCDGDPVRIMGECKENGEVVKELSDAFETSETHRLLLSGQSSDRENDCEVITEKNDASIRVRSSLNGDENLNRSKDEFKTGQSNTSEGEGKSRCLNIPKIDSEELSNSVDSKESVIESSNRRLKSLPTVASNDSFPSVNSPRKSDIINGNVVNLDESSKNLLQNKIDKDRNDRSASALCLQRENLDLTVDPQTQPSTPPGGCLKGGSRSACGVHVQFETPISTKDSEDLEDPYLLDNGKGNFPLKSDSSKFWSKLNSDSCESAPFLSLKKNRKKRLRQPSGSSTTSIGSSSTNTSESRTTEFERRAPDGGWGFVVVFASFMVHCIADGVTMSFGVLYVELLSYFKESKSFTSWVGSLFMAIPLLAGPLASLLTDRYGCRNVTIWGAIISCLGFFLGAFANSMVILLITTGIITGMGFAVCYVAAIVIVAFYFEKYRSLATGVAVAGSGIGTFIFAPIIQYLLEVFGWRGCMIILAGIFLNMAVCGALMRDLAWTKRRSNNRNSSTASSGSRQCSVTQSSDTLGARGYVGESTTLPSIDELKRLVQSGEITSLLSQEHSQSYITRSESLVLLPTFLNHSLLPKEFMPYLSSNANAYEVVSHIYPHLLSRSLSRTLSQSDLLPKELAKESKSKCLQAQLSLQKSEESKEENYITEDEKKELQETSEENKILQKPLEKECLIGSPWTKLDIDEARILSPKRNAKPGTQRQVVSRRISASCIGGASNPPIPAAPLRDMRVPRQSMTFRGAMLNINRYRLRASSCPNIFRNSIITIAETENQNDWSYLDDFGEMLASCIDLNHCLDGSYLIFAMSNFILYMFYDTVYMYLTDYALGVGISIDAGANLISAIGILNCVGMVLMGYIGDQPWSSPMLIYNVSMVACGLSVIVMPFIENYWVLVAAAATFGLFISANYALTAVILVDLISLEAFSKSYGLLLLIQGVANLIGPPLVGFMADATGDYLVPFVVSGIFIVICGLMLSFIPLTQKCKHQYNDNSSRSSPARSPSQRSSPQKSMQFNKVSLNPVSV